LDHLAKPPGSLGRVEDLAVDLAGILGSDEPTLRDPQVLVCVADHGLTARGVSAYPSSVTGAMVRTILAGSAAVSVLARAHGLPLTVVDCGVQADLTSLDTAPAAGIRFIRAPLGPGTADAAAGPAMTAAQCRSALALGRRLLTGLPGNTVVLGELGIGNTSAASLLMVRLTGEPLAACVGTGTGLDAPGLARKRAALATALRANEQARTPEEILTALGGFEIAVLTGAVLAAAEQRRVIVVDGFVTTAAVAVATAMAPATLECCVFAHVSAERGHRRWCALLGARPLLDLDLRLGEATGALLAWPLLPAAVTLLREMATLTAAGVSGPTDPATEPGGQPRGQPGPE